jgi:hypothetical protein
LQIAYSPETSRIPLFNDFSKIIDKNLSNIDLQFIEYSQACRKENNLKPGLIRKI